MPSRDSRYSSLQNWGSYPEYDTTNNTQRSNTNYYPPNSTNTTNTSRSDPRIIGRPSEEYEYEEYRRSQDFESSIRPPIRTHQSHLTQDKQTSGWIDFDNIINSDNNSIGHYRSGHEAGNIDHNY